MRPPAKHWFLHAYLIRAPPVCHKLVMCSFSSIGDDGTAELSRALAGCKELSSLFLGCAKTHTCAEQRDKVRHNHKSHGPCWGGSGLHGLQHPSHDGALAFSFQFSPMLMIHTLPPYRHSLFKPESTPIYSTPIHPSISPVAHSGYLPGLFSSFYRNVADWQW